MKKILIVMCGFLGSYVHSSGALSIQALLDSIDLSKPITQGSSFAEILSKDNDFDYRQELWRACKKEGYDDILSQYIPSSDNHITNNLNAVWYDPCLFIDMKRFIFLGYFNEKENVVSINICRVDDKDLSLERTITCECEEWINTFPQKVPIALGSLAVNKKGLLAVALEAYYNQQTFIMIDLYDIRTGEKVAEIKPDIFIQGYGDVVALSWHSETKILFGLRFLGVGFTSFYAVDLTSGKYEILESMVELCDFFLDCQFYADSGLLIAKALDGVSIIKIGAQFHERQHFFLKKNQYYIELPYQKYFYPVIDEDNYLYWMMRDELYYKKYYPWVTVLILKFKEMVQGIEACMMGQGNTENVSSGLSRIHGDYGPYLEMLDDVDIDLNNSLLRFLMINNA